MRTCCREATAPRDTCYQLLHISCRRRYSAQVGIKGNAVQGIDGLFSWRMITFPPGGAVDNTEASGRSAAELR